MRPTAKHLVLAAAAALLLATPAHALRVMTWNITQYRADWVGYITPQRQADFRTVITGVQPDVLITQELQNMTAVDSLLDNVLNVVQPGQWTGTWINPTESGIFWRTPVVSVTDVSSFATYGPRDVLECWVHPVGYADKAATFRLYSIHLKAGDAVPTTQDSTNRRLDCTDIRNHVNAEPIGTFGPNFLIGGDTNFQGAWEGGYIRLTESQSNNNGQCRDTLGSLMTGTWRDNWFYRYYHTQSPCTTPLPYPWFSGGGVDDRYDLILTSNSLQDDQGLDLFGYVTYGQDGRHLNDNINASGNDSVGYTIATSLRNAADHLPVVAVLQLPAKVAAAAQLDFGTVITGATAEQPLAVANGASWPADSLRYSLGAPAGFTAPAGTFAQAVGAAPTLQTIGMSTAGAGTRTGTLTVSCNDVDSSAKSVLLSGRVLRHAAVSLDSLSEVTEAWVSFGSVPAYHDSVIPLPVHNRGYDADQARLSVTAAEIRGYDTRFSLLGFSPSLVGGTAARLQVRFDASSWGIGDIASPDTLVVHSFDESLPGAAAQPEVRYLLLGDVDLTDASPSLPKVTRLFPPVPNPLLSSSTLRLDVARSGHARLEVFDLSGRRVAVLANREFTPGRYSLRWDGRGDAGSPAGPGLYFVRLTGHGISAQTVRLAIIH